MKNLKAKLILENGSEFYGISFGYHKSVSGEVVFNTAMTGYPESLTDPSYKGQILVATYPLIGNYGVPGKETERHLLKHFESDKIAVSAFVVSEYSDEFSHWNAEESLHDWMHRNKIPGIHGIDTRALTKVLRESGTMLGKIIIDEQDVDFYDPNTRNLVAEVSPKKTEEYGNGKHRVVLIDCGRSSTTLPSRSTIEA
jgi:carbamoyl-phosphate synthase small subunit